jgi:hypothetical protein
MKTLATPKKLPASLKQLKHLEQMRGTSVLNNATSR